MQKITPIWKPEEQPDANPSFPYAMLAVSVLLAGWSYWSTNKSKVVEDEGEEEEEEN